MVSLSAGAVFFLSSFGFVICFEDDDDDDCGDDEMLNDVVCSRFCGDCGGDHYLTVFQLAKSNLDDLDIPSSKLFFM